MATVLNRPKGHVDAVELPTLSILKFRKERGWRDTGLWGYPRLLDYIASNG